MVMKRRWRNPGIGGLLQAACMLAALATVTAHAAERTWVETLPSESSPYVNQTIVLTLRIHSYDDLAVVDPVKPNILGAATEQLDGPITGYQNRGSQRESVTDFRYAVTPITSGTLDVPPVRVRVRYAEGRSPSSWNPYGQGYNYNPWGGGTNAQQLPAQQSQSTTQDLASQPATLQVRAPATPVQPWLPLQGLEMDCQAVAGGKVHVGEPVTVGCVLSAAGAGGEALPSIAAAFNSPDFKVYPDQPQTEQRVSRDGATVLGRRVESYTLIPQHGGTLDLPSVRVTWFDLRRGRQTYTDWTPPPVRVFGGEADTGDTATPGKRSIFDIQYLAFWLPALVMGVFYLGWWIGTGCPGVKGGCRLLRQRVSGLSGRAAASLARLLPARFAAAVRAKVHAVLPQGAVARLGASLRRLLPAPLRISLLMRRIDAAPDAAAAALLLQTYAHRYLGTAVRVPLTRVARALALAHRDLDGPALLALMERLEHSLYGPQTLDLDDWVLELREYLRPRLAWRGPRASTAVAGLPQLNP